MASGELHARLQSVSQRNLGDLVEVAAAIGATTISVYDASDFDEFGGQVSINGTVYKYDSADMVADTIHLTTGLTVAASANDRVDLWDPNTSRPAVYYFALLNIDDQESGDPIEAEIEHSLVPLLTGGMYASGESVTLSQDGAAYRVTSVHGKEASQDAVTYMPGGFTTRAVDGVAGIDVLGQSGGVINFYSGIAGESPASVNPGGIAGFPSMSIYSGDDGTSSHSSKITLKGGTAGANNITFRGSVADFGSMTVNGTGQFSTSGGMVVSGGVNFSGGYVLGGGGSIDGNLTNNTKFTCSGEVHGAQIFSDSPNTNTSAANVFMNSGGQFQKVTSLSRHKVDQQPLSADAVRGVLALTPKTWLDRAEVEENGGDDGLRRIPGLIAEDVERHAPELALYDAEGVLEGVAYDRVAALLIPIIREQQEQIDALTARLEALEQA